MFITRKTVRNTSGVKTAGENFVTKDTEKLANIGTRTDVREVGTVVIFTEIHTPKGMIAVSQKNHMKR